RRGLLAGGRIDRRTDAFHLAGHRAPLRLGQLQPPAAQSAGLVAGAGWVADGSRARRWSLVRPAPAGFSPVGRQRFVRTWAAAVAAAEPALDRAAAAPPPRPDAGPAQALDRARNGCLRETRRRLTTCQGSRSCPRRPRCCPRSCRPA